LVSLTEAVQVLVQSAEKLNPQARMSVETELRKTAEILGAANALEAGAAPSGLGDAMVLEFKPDLSLIVANVGKVHGVKVGMPFRIIRDGRQIGSAKAVDVRERISGAVVQDLASEIPEVGKGDLLQVDAR
jgi:chorismate synthase